MNGDKYVEDQWYQFRRAFSHLPKDDQTEIQKFMVRAFNDGMMTPSKAELDILEAAIAVVGRWDTPAWKDVPHTGEFISKLRNAIGKESS